MKGLEGKEKATIQEYLEYLDSIEGRAEFYDGVIYDMPGSSISHVRISGNIFAELHVSLRGSACEPFTTDLKTEVESERTYTLPDVAVVCGPLELSNVREDIVRNPILVVEVLSESTARFDSTKKFDKYKMLQSLMEYVLVEQYEPRVEVFLLNEKGKWEQTLYLGLDDQVLLASIQQVIPMTSIYRNVHFSEEEE